MNIVIKATRRVTGRKSIVKDIRNAEQVPAVIYRRSEDSIPITIDEVTFITEYRKTIGEIAFFLLEVEGKEYKTVIKEKQIHPVSRRVTHIDFQELIPGQLITFEIPVKYTGDAKGLKEGGNLEILVRKLEITCKPEDIPEKLLLDLSPLGVGQSIHFSDLKLENIHSQLPGNTVLAQVKGSRVGK
ncbi:MAG: 50S ribosomal protein L25 [Candidatus Cloacimonetes bacterium]|nr:50S ribosomal protein L25 [Candidatus Cloacimonadota bacterium]